MKHSLLFFAIPLLAFFGAFGCDEDAAQQNGAGVDAADADEQAEPTQADPAAGAEMMDENNDSTVTITAAESDEQGLPKVEITLNLGDTFMTRSKFPGNDVYLSMSGPPGAPLGLSIQRWRQSIDDEAGWRQYVEQLSQEDSPEFGTAAQAELCGASRSACTYTAGESMARSHHVLASVAIPDSDQSLIVHFWQAAGKTATPAPSDMVRQGKYAELLQSISVRFE